jgi:hypothetical protein
MNTSGRYYLTYDPRPEYATEYIEPDIRMSIDSEANLEQMCSFFDSFLKAAGYVYDGEVAVQGRSAKNEAPAPAQQWSGYTAPSLGLGATSIGNWCPS